MPSFLKPKAYKHLKSLIPYPPKALAQKANGHFVRVVPLKNQGYDGTSFANESEAHVLASTLRVTV
jgi:hypothetical protein